MMDRKPDFILTHSDYEINQILTQKPQQEPQGFSRNFSQDEDFFLRLSKPMEIPSFEIHHDVNNPKPSEAYVNALTSLVRKLHPALPQLMAGLRWYFDPRDHLRPSFFALLRRNEKYYLYALVLDLLIRPRECQIITQGTNTKTPLYQTKNIYLDSYILPLEGAPQDTPQGKLAFVKKLFSDTFKGESGRGYFVQGSWMDPDLNKFLSKLFVPKGKRVYPYFPLRCLLSSLATTVAGLNPPARRKAAVLTDLLVEFLGPLVSSIQDVLKKQEFSPDLPLFQDIQNKIPESIKQYFLGFEIKVDLNEDNQREYLYIGDERGF